MQRGWDSVRAAVTPAPGRPQRLRPLYQYINYDNPEMNRLSEEEGDTPETAAPGEATTGVGKATAVLEESGQTGNGEGAEMGLSEMWQLAWELSGQSL